ncbi:response regulator transcription factor [Fulvivirga lutimaris]|uniref:response regulator transcription factor n=1 Tax=Fulvivirga lutimaris TaxID=1819566 RepID=UPI0012BB7C2E|nr:response regulator transcription factor [Fulvivirga lutimaris]MTI39381.1 response regulator transcription factor [Fulvivirga lutimaris]
MNGHKILLAEDDENLGYVLKEYLEMHEYNVTLARDGEEGLEFFTKSAFDLCILDVMMPKMDGFTLASKIKEIDENTPFLFLTAKALKIDKLKGFKLGADDYIVKPVDEEELFARIQAIVKRAKPKAAKEIEILNIGAYTFNYPNLELKIKGNGTQLTQKEADLLKALYDSQGSILDRNSTLKKLWGENDYFNRRSMDVFISRLRKYLEQDPNIKIKNVHGKGFVLDIH